MRAGVTIAAAIHNMQCKVWLLDGVTPIELAALTAELRALPFVAPFFTPGNRQKVVREAFGAGFSSGYSLIDPADPGSLRLEKPHYRGHRGTQRKTKKPASGGPDHRR